jgi:hypothetical protein
VGAISRDLGAATAGRLARRSKTLQAHDNAGMWWLLGERQTDEPGIMIGREEPQSIPAGSDDRYLSPLHGFPDPEGFRYCQDRVNSSLAEGRRNTPRLAQVIPWRLELGALGRTRTCASGSGGRRSIR